MRRCSFNTQPPEGGCCKRCDAAPKAAPFQHTATRRWLRVVFEPGRDLSEVSTHSHPKVAANFSSIRSGVLEVSTHSHPKVAASAMDNQANRAIVSTHSHPKVAAAAFCCVPKVPAVSTHSHPKVAACEKHNDEGKQPFQHTATRRWLLGSASRLLPLNVFQHTATRRWLLGYFIYRPETA